MSDTDFYEVIESQRAVVFQNKEKTVLIVATDFKFCTGIRFYCKKICKYSRTRRPLSEHIFEIEQKVTQRLLIKYQIISDLQAKQEIEHRHMSTHSKSH